MQRRHFLSLAATTTATATAVLTGCGPMPGLPAETIASGEPTGPEREAASSRLQALADSYMNRLLDHDPFWASTLGVATHAQASSVPMGIDRETIERMNAVRRETLRQLDGIDPSALSETERTTADVLRHHASDALAMSAFPTELMAVHHMPDNVPFLLASAEANGLSRFATVQDHALHLERLAAVPAWCEVAERNFLEGVRTGVCQPTVVLQRFIPMLAAMATADLAVSPFMQSAQAQSVGARQRKQYEQVVTQQVIPALQRLVQLLEAEVLPASRLEVGLTHLPNGEAWYAQCVRSRTTTELRAQDIHALGLQEVERLQAELRQVQKTYGHKGTVEAFLAWHGQRPEAKPFQTEVQILRAYEAIDHKVRQQLPTLINRLPKAGFEIRAEPEATKASANDHYTPPSADGKRPGVFFAAINQPSAYGSALMTTMLLHEGQPGHHCQVGLAQELPLTRLQRHWFNDAYGEGWAFYAETLGKPLGLYEDPDAYVGHLSLAMLRAVRLVVDTGLHQGTWSRARSIAYLRANTGFSQIASQGQIDRYLVFPGQALSYSLGRIQIEDLRDSSQATLGSRFTLPAFHDQVLGSGTLPLSMLEKKIKRWAVTASTAA